MTSLIDEAYEVVRKAADQIRIRAGLIRKIRNVPTETAKCMCDYRQFDCVYDADPPFWANVDIKIYPSRCVYCRQLHADPTPDLELCLQDIVERKIAFDVYHRNLLTSKRTKAKHTKFRLLSGNLEVVQGTLTQWDEPAYFFRDFLPVGVFRSEDGAWILDLRMKITNRYHKLQREGEQVMRVPLFMHMSKCALFDANVFGIIRSFVTRYERKPKKVNF